MREVAVLVVGAGPVGLATAMELGWRGQDVLVIEAGDGVVDHPRAGGVSIRTMEFCRRWGIVDEVRAGGFPDDYALDIVFTTGFDGYDLIREPYPTLRDMPTPAESPERRQRCPQMWFDPILARAASRFDSVALHYHTRAGQLEITPDNRVVVHCTDTQSGETTTIRARYVVACDGAMSNIRAHLGIGMSGIPLLNYSVGVFFRSPDLLTVTGQGQAARFIFIGPTGPLGNLTVVDGKDLWRFTYIAGAGRPDLDAVDVEGVMRGVLGARPDLEILSVAPWRRSQLVADAYRHGPVFLVGDSAHTMSPTGGFGSNTGIGEAVDLGWKLDAVLRGWGGEALLDSYEAERRPIAIRNTAAATSNFRGWYSKADLSGLLEPGRDGDRLRRSVGEELVEGTRAEWESKGVILGYRYEHSPICVPDGSPEPADDYHWYEPTNRPGHRAPHAWLGPHRSTLDLFGSGFVLLASPGAGHDTRLADAAVGLGVPLRREPLPDGLESVYSTRYTLVRPDGHVAWRGDRLPDNPEAVVRTITGNHTS